MGGSVKSLAEIKVDNIHCPPLIYPAGHTNSKALLVLVFAILHKQVSCEQAKHKVWWRQ